MPAPTTERRASGAGLPDAGPGRLTEIRIRGLEESDTGFFDLRDETGALVDKILLQNCLAYLWIFTNKCLSILALIEVIR